MWKIYKETCFYSDKFKMFIDIEIWIETTTGEIEVQEKQGFQPMEIK
jgi:hypothetical protein